MNWLAIGLAGGLGTLARYGLSFQLNRLNLFPWGTLLVNILGSFLAGLVFHLATEKLSIDEPMRLIIAVGFLGGFTTFSAFSLETINLWQSGRVSLAISYAIASLLFSFSAVILGMKVA